MFSILTSSMILTLNFKNAFFFDYARSVLMFAAENGHKDVLAFCVKESSLSTPNETHVDSSSPASSYKNQVTRKNAFDVNPSSGTSRA